MVERSGQTGHIRDYSVEPPNSISASFRSGWRQRFQGTVEMRSLFRAFVFLSSPGAVALPSYRSRRRPDRKFMSGTITPLASIILSQTRDQLTMSSSIRSRVGAQCSHVSFINLKTSFGVPCEKIRRGSPNGNTDASDKFKLIPLSRSEKRWQSSAQFSGEFPSTDHNILLHRERLNIGGVPR